jgi:hypothetical protein
VSFIENEVGDILDKYYKGEFYFSDREKYMKENNLDCYYESSRDPENQKKSKNIIYVGTNPYETRRYITGIRYYNDDELLEKIQYLHEELKKIKEANTYMLLNGVGIVAVKTDDSRDITSFKMRYLDPDPNAHKYMGDKVVIKEYNKSEMDSDEKILKIIKKLHEELKNK